MAKEFDIYLRKRIHECDLIVTSLAYRDGLTVTNRLLLESCIKEYTLQRFFAAETDVKLVAHIDNMLETVYNILEQASVDIETDAKLSGLVFSDGGNSQININSTESLSTTLNQYFQGESDLELSQTSLIALIKKFAGYANSRIDIKQAVYQTLAYALEQFESEINIKAVINGEGGIKYLNVDAATELMTDLKNLCYRYYNSGAAGMELAALVLGTEFHFSLGRAISGIIMGSKVSRDNATKFILSETTLDIAAEATGSTTQFVSFDDVAVEIAAIVEPILKRYRLLLDLNDGSLSLIDDMTLGDLDYVII